MLIKRLFLLTDLILIALAVYVGVSGVYAVFTSSLDTITPVPTVQSAAASNAKVAVPPFSDFGIIAQRDLFHTHKTSAKPASKLMLNTLQETQLKLKLRGTVAGDPENSYAFIEDEKDHKQNLYKVNDTIQNATVKMILTDKVVLSVAGKDEILELEERSSTTSSTSQRSTSITARTSSTATAAGSTSTRRISLSRAQVDSAMENLTDLMGQINIQPYNQDGKQGLLLNNIKPNSIFRRMGLRNGDILTAVGGQPLTSVDQAYKLYEDLKSSDTANVAITRRGRDTNIEYRIR